MKRLHLDLVQAHFSSCMKRHKLSDISYIFVVTQLLGDLKPHVVRNPTAQGLIVVFYVQNWML